MNVLLTVALSGCVAECHCWDSEDASLGFYDVCSLPFAGSGKRKHVQNHTLLPSKPTQTGIHKLGPFAPGKSMSTSWCPRQHFCRVASYLTLPQPTGSMFTSPVGHVLLKSDAQTRDTNTSSTLSHRSMIFLLHVERFNSFCPRHLAAT